MLFFVDAKNVGGASGALANNIRSFQLSFLPKKALFLIPDTDSVCTSGD
jgi:hypothetical protein